MNIDQLLEDDTKVDGLDNTPDLEEGVYDDPDKDEPVEDNTDEVDDIEEEDNIDGDDVTDIDDDTDDNSNDDDTTEVDEDSEDDVEVNDTTDSDSEPIYLDLGDKKIEAKDTDELQNIAKTALKGKLKYDQYKDDIALIEGIKKQGLSEEDLFLLVEAKKGNNKALAKLLKKSNVDPMNIDTDDEEVDAYRPNVYKVDSNEIEIKSIIDNTKNTDKFPVFENLITKEFDDSSRGLVFKDPNNLQFVSDLVTSGLFDKIAPKYMKNKLLGSSNSFEALVKAYDDYVKDVEVKKEDTARDVTNRSKSKANKRKKATTGRKTASKSVKKDPENMSEEEFEQYYKTLMGPMADY